MVQELLATVSSSATAGQLTVTNANNFQSQNTYQVWSALGGTNRGTITVLTVDSINNILYLHGCFPGRNHFGRLALGEWIVWNRQHLAEWHSGN